MVAKNHTVDGCIESDSTEFVDVGIAPTENDMVMWVNNNPNIGNADRVMDAGDGYVVFTDSGEVVENNIAHVGLTIVEN